MLALAAALTLTTTLVASTLGCRSHEPVVVVHGERGPVRVRVELALTRDQQSRGLMWRDDLDTDAGMLFVFPRDGELSFWMKNTPTPLDIIYIDKDAKVVSVGERTTPYSLDRIPSHGPARYALEVNAGFADEHGVRPGTRVELPELPPLPETQGKQRQHSSDTN